MSEEIIFDLLQEQDPLAEIVQETFPLNEPMSRCLGLSLEDYLPYTELVCQKAVSEKMTIVARLKRSGEIIGFCINEDFMSAPIYSAENISSKMKPLLYLLEALDHKYFGASPVKAREFFHLYMLGVRADWNGMGIGEKLVKESLRLGCKLGFSQMVLEATGATSQKIATKLGFIEKEAICYSSFVHNGEKVFAPIQGVNRCCLMMRNSKFG